MNIDRREFLKLTGMGSIIFVTSGMGLTDQINHAASMGADDFFFVQLSDTHWGFSGQAVNPDSGGTLKKAVAAVNELTYKPAFIMFTGDLTHTTDDVNERKKRLQEFRKIISELTIKNVRFMPGEHDAGLDGGAAFKELFGPSNYTFDLKGVHFIVLDNVSDPTSQIGEAQLQWLSDDLQKLDKSKRIIIFTHRPLFDLYPDWDWFTRDGAKAIELLMPFPDVTVFYGHIHQEHHHKTAHISHHAAQGLMYPLPAPGSVPVKKPVLWDPAHPYKGLGFRSVTVKAIQKELSLTEYDIKGVKL